MAYIDTSVLAACYCPEPLSGKAQQALAALEEPTISRLVELELHSAAALKVRRHELTRPTARRVIGEFRRHVADGCYRSVPIGPREYELASDWIAGFSVPLRAMDALHLAAAFGNELQLLTADRVLARSARHFGVSCDLIF